MRQPSKRGNNPQPKKKKNIVKHKRFHPKYGTSKLEEHFASEFLDKLGVEYVYQFEAKDIGRFYDFYLPKSNLIIEIDGDYWHGNPDKYSDEDLKGHQKRARRIDEYKDKWALLHSIPIMRIWESDIRKNPKGVMDSLKERLRVQNEKIRLDEEKKKRH